MKIIRMGTDMKINRMGTSTLLGWNFQHKGSIFLTLLGI
jgi:hypothetical protein